MATMVVQLGLATIPLGRSARAWALTSGTTSGTSGSMRHAEELSTTVTPAAAAFGASDRLAVAPAEKRARSRPAQSAVAASSTATASPRQSIVRPTERAEANRRRRSTGKSRSARIRRITCPT